MTLFDSASVDAALDRVDVDDDHALARALAGTAGDLLMHVRDQGVDRTSLSDLGDLRSHQFITGQLARLRPGDSVLSEEGVDDDGRQRSSRVWIIDPLDGSREYGEGRTDWAVHVALWEDGELVAGAVALPAVPRIHSTEQPPSVPERAAGPWRLAVSRSRPPAFVNELAAVLGAELVPMGSAGVKATAVVRGEVDAYVHAGGQYEWDSAAPVAVARAAGLHTSRIDGSELCYNGVSAWLPDLVVCRTEVRERILRAVADLDRHEGATAR